MPSVPMAEERIYDLPPVELPPSSLDNSKPQLATPAGSKDVVIYDTVPVEKITAGDLPSSSMADRPQWFRALFSFESSVDGEISFSIGDLLQQVKGEEREQKGWVMVERNGEQGWAPASYLEPEEVESDATTSQEQQGV